MRRRKKSIYSKTNGPHPKIKGIAKWKKGLIVLLVIIMAGLAGMIYSARELFYSPNVVLKEPDRTHVLIPTGSSFENVLAILQKQGLLKHPTYFKWVAMFLHYHKNIKPGRYLIKEGLGSEDLVKILSGKQDPVKLVINSIHTKEQLAARLGRQLEPDSVAFLRALCNQALLRKYELNEQSALSLVIPDIYELDWNSTPQQIMDRFASNYEAFWNEERRKKADEMGLTPQQVSSLAAIVEQESKKKEERPVIAGVYINRFKKGQKLEADPTLIYALGNFSARRVLNGYKDIDSPYNTYKYKGLPPGPICIPSANAIDAVLNYSKHNYLYFCAREDFSGYHNYACNYNQHLVNARKYQKELNKRNIKE